MISRLAAGVVGSLAYSDCLASCTGRRMNATAANLIERVLRRRAG